MLAKPRVEQVACLLGQSLRTGRWSPPPPTACMSTLNCVCVCVGARAREVRSERRVRGSACSKRVPVMRANRAPGASARAARRRAGRDRVGLDGMESGRDCNQVF